MNQSTSQHGDAAPRGKPQTEAIDVHFEMDHGYGYYVIRVTDSYNYDITEGELFEPRDLDRWVRHLKEKTWFGPATEKRLRDAYSRRRKECGL